MSVSSNIAAGQRLVRRIGLLPIATFALVSAAAFLHATYFPGAVYTWFRPAEILYGVIRDRAFPSIAVVVFVAGLAVRPSVRDALRRLPRAGLRSWWASLELSTRAAAAACALAAVVAALASDADYSRVDLAAIALIGGYAGSRRFDPRAWARFALELALIVLLFVFVSYGFTVLKALLFRLVEPKDASIVALERAITGVPLHAVIARWAARSPAAVLAADRVYYLMFHHMVLVSVFLVGCGRRRERMAYMSALAICYLVGAFAYHVYPVLGPAFHDPAAFEYVRSWPTITSGFQSLLGRNVEGVVRERVTILRTYEYVAAMPSLHMAHELVMLWYSRRSKPFFALSLAFVVMTSAAVVILGWHYVTDIVAGAVLAAGSIATATACGEWLLPAYFGEGSAAAAPDAGVEPCPAVPPLSADP